MESEKRRSRLIASQVQSSVSVDARKSSAKSDVVRFDQKLSSNSTSPVFDNAEILLETFYKFFRIFLKTRDASKYDVMVTSGLGALKLLRVRNRISEIGKLTMTLGNLLAHEGNFELATTLLTESKDAFFLNKRFLDAALASALIAGNCIQSNDPIGSLKALLEALKLRSMAKIDESDIMTKMLRDNMETVLFKGFKRFFTTFAVDEQCSNILAEIEDHLFNWQLYAEKSTNATKPTVNVQVRAMAKVNVLNMYEEMLTKASSNARLRTIFLEERLYEFSVRLQQQATLRNMCKNIK